MHQGRPVTVLYTEYGVNSHPSGPLTLSSANGVTTINIAVFDLVNIKWKSSNVDLPAVVLPGADFGLFLGLTWIVKAGVGLNAERSVVAHQGKETPLKPNSFPKPPKGAVTTIIYAQEHCRVPPMGSASLKLTPFKQGSHGRHFQPEMPRFIALGCHYIRSQILRGCWDPVTSSVRAPSQSRSKMTSGLAIRCRL